jgi:hypothetical protein
MDTIELDVKILNKLLNSKLFLDKYPIIDRVAVDKYGKVIEIVLIVNNTKEYFYNLGLRDEINSFIRDIAKSASVDSYFNVYP